MNDENISGSLQDSIDAYLDVVGGVVREGVIQSIARALIAFDDTPADVQSGLLALAHTMTDGDAADGDVAAAMNMLEQLLWADGPTNT